MVGFSGIAVGVVCGESKVLGGQFWVLGGVRSRAVEAWRAHNLLNGVLHGGREAEEP